MILEIREKLENGRNTKKAVTGRNYHDDVVLEKFRFIPDYLLEMD